MSDILGEPILTEPESEEDIAAARERSRLHSTSEVVLLYVICLGSALALAALLVVVDRRLLDRRLPGDAGRQHPEPRPLGADRSPCRCPSCSSVWARS